MNTSSIGKFEGRLFSEAGRLCLVVEANETTGMGRISYRADGERQLVDLPLTEIRRRLSLGANLILDNISGSESANRIERKKDGWYFSAREGLKGPYRSGEEAERELGQYVLSAQTA